MSLKASLTKQQLQTAPAKKYKASHLSLVLLREELLLDILYISVSLLHPLGITCSNRQQQLS
jgi:hypothetical protein